MPLPRFVRSLLPHEPGCAAAFQGSPLYLGKGGQQQYGLARNIHQFGEEWMPVAMGMARKLPEVLRSESLRLRLSRSTLVTLKRAFALLRSSQQEKNCGKLRNIYFLFCMLYSMQCIGEHHYQAINPAWRFASKLDGHRQRKEGASRFLQQVS